MWFDGKNVNPFQDFFLLLLSSLAKDIARNEGRSRRKLGVGFNIRIIRLLITHYFWIRIFFRRIPEHYPDHSYKMFSIWYPDNFKFEYSLDPTGEKKDDGERLFPFLLLQPRKKTCFARSGCSWNPISSLHVSTQAMTLAELGIRTCKSWNWLEGTLSIARPSLGQSRTKLKPRVPHGILPAAEFGL